MKNHANDTAPNWLPGQGLTMRGTNMLISAHGVPKLMALVNAKAITLEFWVAPDTCFPATQQCGALLCWKQKGDGRRQVNFMVRA